MHARRFLIVTITALTMTNTGIATAMPDASEELTGKAASLFCQDKLQDAVDVQQEAVKCRPDDWLSHAALSFYYWQQGNVMNAAEEGQTAVNLAPRQQIALLNLAAMKEGLDDCAGAIPLYEGAISADPSNWKPVLGLARCYIKSGQESQGLDTLKTMLSQSSVDFDWYQELGDTYLRLDKPALAVEATKKAKSLCSTIAQKESNACQMLLALVRDNQLNEAKALAPHVFKSCHPSGYELYVRMAATLVPPAQPKEGATLLNAAVNNLTSAEDGEGFFKLGRVFEQKASAIDNNAVKSGAWLENAAVAYRQALAVNKQNTTEQAKYHVSLVGVLEKQGNRAGMIDELTAAQSLDQFSQLVPFLRGKLAAQTNWPKQRSGIALTCVDFKIKGLNCDCQISKGVESLGKVNGVAFAHIVPATKPDEGTLLFDPAAVSIEQVFFQARETFREVYAKMTKPIDINFEVTASKPISTVQDAIGIAQSCEHGDVLKFFTTFKPVTPSMPVSTIAAYSKATTN